MKTARFPMVHDRETDDYLFESMQEEIILPEIVKEKMQTAYTFVQKDSSAKSRKTKRIRKMLVSSISIAAAVLVFCVVCTTNTAFASKIPLIGRVFVELGESLGFSGNYEEYAKPLDGTTDIEKTVTTANTGTTGEDSAFSKTRNGMTITLSEVYCNETALYLSIVLESEEAFQENVVTDAPSINLYGNTIQTVFLQEAWHNPDSYLDGRMIDDHTFAGVMRIEWRELPELVKLPESFAIDLHIPMVLGDRAENTTPDIPDELWNAYNTAILDAGLDPAPEAYESYSEEQKKTADRMYSEMIDRFNEMYPGIMEFPNQYENWWIDGPWDFTFDVVLNHSDTMTRIVNADGACDIGEIEIVRTPFELEVNYNQEKAVDYFVVITDADGARLEYGNNSGSADTWAVGGRDVSKVTVYVVDYVQYMDELKGYYTRPGYEERAKEKTFAEYLDEHCIYCETIQY